MKDLTLKDVEEYLTNMIKNRSSNTEREIILSRYCSTKGHTLEKTGDFNPCDDIYCMSCQSISNLLKETIKEEMNNKNILTLEKEEYILETGTDNFHNEIISLRFIQNEEAKIQVPLSVQTFIETIITPVNYEIGKIMYKAYELGQELYIDKGEIKYTNTAFSNVPTKVYTIVSGSE